jgi:hypothetical protein
MTGRQKPGFDVQVTDHSFVGLLDGAADAMVVYLWVVQPQRHRLFS